MSRSGTANADRTGPCLNDTGAADAEAWPLPAIPWRPHVALRSDGTRYGQCWRCTRPLDEARGDTICRLIHGFATKVDTCTMCCDTGDHRHPHRDRYVI